MSTSVKRFVGGANSSKSKGIASIILSSSFLRFIKKKLEFLLKNYELVKLSHIRSKMMVFVCFNVASEVDFRFDSRDTPISQVIHLPTRLPSVNGCSVRNPVLPHF